MAVLKLKIKQKTSSYQIFSIYWPGPTRTIIFWLLLFQKRGAEYQHSCRGNAQSDNLGAVFKSCLVVMVMMAVNDHSYPKISSHM